MKQLKRGIGKLMADVVAPMIPRDPDRWEVSQSNEVCSYCREGAGQAKMDDVGRFLLGLKRFRWHGTNVERVVIWKCPRCGITILPSYPSPVSSNLPQKELTKQVLATDVKLTKRLLKSL